MKNQVSLLFRNDRPPLFKGGLGGFHDLPLNPPRIPLFQRGKTRDPYVKDDLREHGVQNKYRFWTRVIYPVR